MTTSTTEVRTIATFRFDCRRWLQRVQHCPAPTTGWVVKYRPALADRGWEDWHPTRESARQQFDEFAGSIGASIEECQRAGEALARVKGRDVLFVEEVRS